MVIMNKMTTLDLSTRSWSVYRDRSSESPPKYTYVATMPNIMRGTTNIASDFLHFVAGAWGVGDINSMAVSANQLYVVSDILNDPTAFKQAMQGVLVTYETADSTEEAIISYRPQQLTRNGNFEGLTYWYVYSGTGSVSNNELTVTGAVGRGGVVISDSAYYYQLISGHKYFVNIEHKATVKLQAYIVKSMYLEPSDQWVKHQEIVTRADGVGSNSDIFPDRSGEVGTFSLRNIMVVDLTALYGAGNEPTSVETFLSQHPEYNSYVPYYDGPISIEEEIIEKEALKPVMADNEWADIFDAFKNDSAPDTWQVGDTKPLTLLDGTTYTIRLCDKQAGRYQYSDGSGSSKAVFEFVELVKLGSTITFRMNYSNTNANGWASSYMRGTTIPNFETFLPEDILAAIGRVNVLSGKGSSTTSGTASSANKLFVPAEMEMFSSRTYSIGSAECPLGQFDYYKAHNTNADRIKKQLGSTSGSTYWLRSPNSGDPYCFSAVYYDGSASYAAAPASYGIPLIFAV